MNVADYTLKFLSDRGVRSIFMVTGGQAMFLNDAVYRAKKIEPIFCHHEQAVGMAAEAYARTKGTIGVAMVTAGPGAVNVLNGVVGAWVDSAPLLVISGQSNLANVSYMDKTRIRQHGLQGIKIKNMVSDVVKFFVTIEDPAKIKYYLEKAYALATENRKGPVWLEIPLDIQRMEVPENLQSSFEIPKSDLNVPKLEAQIDKLVGLLGKSKRPLLLGGQGVIYADARNEFKQLYKTLNVPTITTRLGIDLIDSSEKLFVGRPGLYGDRPSNFAVQNADLIISVGARLDYGIVGYDSGDWGRNAKIVVVDIDDEELNKPNVKAHIKIKADCRLFMRDLLGKTKREKLPDWNNWVAKCSQWKMKYPMVLPEFRKENPVNSYYFAEVLASLARENDTILLDTSSCFHVVSQAWKVKEGQRFLTTGGISTMGYWVASIGASVAKNKGRVLAITGDGSFQFNVQELATLKQNKLPIKLFVLDNEGYLLIRHTQKTHLGGRLMGESPQTGLYCPNAAKVADAYGIASLQVSKTSELKSKLANALKLNGPVVCNIKSPKWQTIGPRVSSERRPDGSFVSHPFEDMFPFLPRDEFKKNMAGE